MRNIHSNNKVRESTFLTNFKENYIRLYPLLYTNKALYVSFCFSFMYGLDGHSAEKASCLVSRFSARLLFATFLCNFLTFRKELFSLQIGHARSFLVFGHMPKLAAIVATYNTIILNYHTAAPLNVRVDSIATDEWCKCIFMYLCDYIKHIVFYFCSSYDSYPR